MFLKRIELHGFKSFADKTNIEFQPGITGIVGPNGCGKSNISDAVRWVLGEQSVKSLRGSSMSDVIFSGSEDRRAQSLAEVTLVFDNSDHFMKYDYDEVEITRRLYRAGNESEYLINREQCRLKDIVDLIMDTGLGRDSLSIISQGNISSFADSKPEERRAIFEEAAGVAKYKKRKLTSLRKLERTKDNLDRIGDIVHELEKQVEPLKRQKDKAETYLSLKEELTSIEVNVLVKEISEAKASLDTLSNVLKSLTEIQTSIDVDISLKETSNEETKTKMFELDREINQLQSQLLETVSHVSELETTKVETDQKRRFMLENSSKEQIQQQLEQLKLVLSDTVTIYNNRVDRLEQIQLELDEMSKNRDKLTKDVTTIRDEIEYLTIQINQNRIQKERLIDLVENKSNYHPGVKAMLDYKKNRPGIIGVLGDLIQVRENYEMAISTALGGAFEFIVTTDDYEARKAIKFLRDNKAGRATFLPINIIKPKRVREEHMMVCHEIRGYLGIASDFVSYDDKLEDIVYSQLGNVIVADTLEHASNISKATFSRYRVVSLDGDVVNVGGSLTGGSYKKQQSSLLQKRELEQVSDLLAKQEQSIIEKRNLFSHTDNELKEVAHELLVKQMSYAKMEVVVQSKREDLMKVKAEYESISNQKVELDDFISGKTENQLLTQLNEAIQLRDRITDDIKLKRELRMNYLNENESLEKTLKSLRQELRENQTKINEKSIEATKIEASLNTNLNRLGTEYNMTYEFASETYVDEIDMEKAKESVHYLRNEIDRLGNVNLDAIEEYAAVSSRYETMNQQRLDLLAAQERILEAIDEMDQIMIDRFSSTFEKINTEFNHVFRSLFGGGKARVKYSDPDNILETGIDIDVQPPGKAVQNISLFSGGEKALIAISCLFAILRVQPVPMCILDEVEAALDMANVERFAKYLREFSKSTQFIVVTHREGTMEECDLLYGATMQSKGVTKLVSVRLEEAIDLSSEQA